MFNRFYSQFSKDKPMYYLPDLDCRIQKTRVASFFEALGITEHFFIDKKILQGSTFGQQQQQKYGTAHHDQIMANIDAKMRARPHPPPMAAGQFGQSTTVAAAGAAQERETALRVRRWIESKTVTDVKVCRPLLNREIQQGLVLRKNKVSNDRSAPRF